MKNDTKEDAAPNSRPLNCYVPPSFTHLDLFSGIGAFALAAHWQGWQTVAFCEKDEFCRKVLRKNFGENIKIYDDILQFSGKPFRGANVVTAGFPCQDTSQANTNGIGLDGERSGLWKEAVRVIAEVQPDWVVLENVANYVRVDVDRLCGSLENEGYETTAFDFRACCVGLPTLERHIWIIAANSSQRREKSTEKLSSELVQEKPFLRGYSGNRERRTICEFRVSRNTSKGFPNGWIDLNSPESALSETP